MGISSIFQTPKSNDLFWGKAFDLGEVKGRINMEDDVAKREKFVRHKDVPTADIAVDLKTSH